MKSFISLEEAIDILDENVKTIGTEEIELINATGRVLAEDIHSTIDNPPFNKSAMDGYAILAENSGFNDKIKIIDKIFAGEVSSCEVTNKTAIRIMTGAPIPKGANAVIKQEDTIKHGEDYITLTKEINVNDNICFKGEDIKKGDILVNKNKKINFADVGIIASTGIARVRVFKKPRIALLCTGDEVVDVGSKLESGKIFNSSKYTIASRVSELGYNVSEVKHVRDVEGDIEKYIESISKNVDLIITTGGVSVGEKDLLNAAIDNIGGKRLFWKVKMKPGSAVLCSIVNNALVISLSGNPTAALTAFELFVKTSIEKLSGIEKIEIKREKAVLCDNFNKKSPQRRFIRGRVIIEEGKQKVYITQVKSGNGILSSNLNSNCMIEVEAGTEALHSGETVNIIKF